MGIDFIDLDAGVVSYCGVVVPICAAYDGDGDETDDPDEARAIVFSLPGDGIWVSAGVSVTEDRAE